jgi:hypothetical protein
MELNRRQFTIAFATASAAAASFVSATSAIANAIPEADKFGKITTKTHACKVRVSIDGNDVTNDAFEADDIAGYADCYLCGDDGKWMIDKDTNSFVFARRYGNVLIEWK